MGKDEVLAFGVNGFVVLKHDRYQEDSVDDVAVGTAVYALAAKKIAPGDKVLYPWGAEKYIITVGEDHDFVAVPEDSLIMVVKEEAPAPQISPGE